MSDYYNNISNEVKNYFSLLESNYPPNGYANI